MISLHLKIFGMKKKFPFFSILLISVFGYGQAYERAVQDQDKLQPAAVIELPYPPSVHLLKMRPWL
jgi:predicted nucleotidyltransferase